MAKKKPARKTRTSKKKSAPKKPARKTKATPKRSSVRRKSKGKKSAKAVKGNIAVVEVAEIDVIAEPEELGQDDGEFPPDYGGSE